MTTQQNNKSKKSVSFEDIRSGLEKEGKKFKMELK